MKISLSRIKLSVLPGLSEDGTPVLEGKSHEHRKYIFGSHTTRGIFYGSAYPIRSVRSSTYKYIRNLNPEGKFTNLITEESGLVGWSSWFEKAAFDEIAVERIKLYQHRPAEELYDLSLDPYELNNVAYKAEYREILNELRAQLDQWMKQQGDRGLEGELAVKARGGLSQ